MIKITDEGFWVRGVQITQDDKEAETVYNAFKQFLMCFVLTVFNVLCLVFKTSF